jgi:hypothetical protein
MDISAREDNVLPAGMRQRFTPSRMFKSNEQEQLFHNARCGRFHSTNVTWIQEIVAKAALRFDLGEQPRWG